MCNFLKRLIYVYDFCSDDDAGWACEEEGVDMNVDSDDSSRMKIIIVLLQGGSNKDFKI